MARYLVYTSPARGHVYPLVPTLEELRRRGHEVAVRTLESEGALMRQASRRRQRGRGAARRLPAGPRHRRVAAGSEDGLFPARAVRVPPLGLAGGDPLRRSGPVGAADRAGTGVARPRRAPARARD